MHLPSPETRKKKTKNLRLDPGKAHTTHETRQFLHRTPIPGFVRHRCFVCSRGHSLPAITLTPIIFLDRSETGLKTTDLAPPNPNTLYSSLPPTLLYQTTKEHTTCFSDLEITSHSVPARPKKPRVRSIPVCVLRLVPVPPIPPLHKLSLGARSAIWNTHRSSSDTLFLGTAVAAKPSVARFQQLPTPSELLYNHTIKTTNQHSSFMTNKSLQPDA